MHRDERVLDDLLGGALVAEQQHRQPHQPRQCAAYSCSSAASASRSGLMASSTGPTAIARVVTLVRRSSQCRWLTYGIIEVGGSVVVEDCLFCGIVAGDVDADVVHVTERTVAFRDLNAQAPTHVLVVPKDHYANAAELAAGDPAATAELVSDRGGRGHRRGPRRLPAGLQHRRRRRADVFHTHLHLLAGRPMTWPPG